MAFEAEYGGTLKIANRPGNSLSAVLRQAWDGAPLRTLTKNSPQQALEPHVSVVGHATDEEVRQQLRSTDVANGFANRFIWVRVKRSKLLPDGGTLRRRDLTPLVAELRRAVEEARRYGRIERDSAARELWHQVYPVLAEGEPGIVGALTARAEAQVNRLSMVYALLDRSATIHVEHLRAALALWDYSHRSIRFLFGRHSGDSVADKLRAALEETPEGLTRTQLHQRCGRHIQASRLDQALQALAQSGSAICAPPEPSGGRPTERWLSAPSAPSSHTGPEPPSDDIYHGLVGRIIETLDPHTEADPVAITTQLLVAFGSACGRNPHMAVEADRHHTNLFLVLVGDTAKARKGTSWGHARSLIATAAPEWEPCVRSGLSTGEGLIAQVADRESSEVSEETSSTL